MMFLYHKDAGVSDISIKGDEYRHLFKARRQKKEQSIKIRNLKDDFLYIYRVENVSKKEAMLKLIERKKLIVKPKKNLHLGWCLIDTKVVEKSIPFLNEIGVKKITFIYCERSQRNFKINLEKLEKIAINSSQQCGRSDLITFEISDSLERFLQTHQEYIVLDFGGKDIKTFDTKIDPLTAIIGCEGGFSEKERSMFDKKSIYSFDTDAILRSQSASIALSAIYLLS